MDTDRIDQLARYVAASGSRRAVLGGLLGIVAGLGWLRPADEPAALAKPKRRRKRKRCKGARQRCGKKCVNVKRDRRHCGKCRRRCKGGERCQRGRCRPPRPSTAHCRPTLEAAGCAFNQDQNRWDCPNGTDLIEADLSNCDLRNALLRQADLSEASLINANLSGADLFSAKLSDAELIGANLRDAELSGANLTEADLRKADLAHALLFAANFAHANLFNAKFEGANLGNALWNDTICPDGENTILRDPQSCCGHFLEGAEPGVGCAI